MGHVFNWLFVSVAVGCMLPLVMSKVDQEGSGKRVAKQIHQKPTLIDTDSDHKAAETGFGGAEIGGHGKYFQYQHNPEHDHYEFGYRRGNEHHFQERYEKAAPHQGHFKTKARWGDKHGGYGEHYWDYNHAGHADEGGDDGGSDGGYSEPIPNYQAPQNLHHKVTAKRESAADQPTKQSVTDQRVKRQQKKTSAVAPSLIFDLASGQVIDEATGQAYILQPIQ